MALTLLSSDKAIASMTKKMEAAANLLFGKDEVMGVNSHLHVDESSRSYRFFAEVAATLQVSVEVEENSKHKAKSVAEGVLHDLSDYLQLSDSNVADLASSSINDVAILNIEEIEEE